MNHPGLVLFSSGLLHEFGNYGGAMPGSILDYCHEHDVDFEARNWRDVLCELVRAHLLPELRKHHVIELVDVETGRNPIRVTMVDGREIDERLDSLVSLTPWSVTVPIDAVVAAMQDVGKDAPGKPSN